MPATRINTGKQTGLFVATIGSWNLRQTADGRYKVAAIDPVNGKANYSFGVKDGKIDTHIGLDCTKLAEEHPELFKSIEAYFKEAMMPTQSIDTDEADPYGDLALARRRKLTPEQNWKRGLLQMRRLEFEHAAVGASSIWESAVRMLWAGCFGTKIAEPDLDKARQWITQRKGSVDVKDLLRVEQDYYAGKFAPNSSTLLEQNLDTIAGANEFENVEEKKEVDPLDAFR